MLKKYDSATIVGMPLDRLGMLLLGDIVAEQTADVKNYFQRHQAAWKDEERSLRALSEAFAWLVGVQYVAAAMWYPAGVYIVTRAGAAALAAQPR